MQVFDVAADGDSVAIGLGAGRILRCSVWTALIPGLAVLELVSARDPAAEQMTLTAALGAFFVLLLGRLAVAAIAQRHRRYPLLMLSAGVLLWAVGSALLNGSGQPGLTSFPTRGEIFFLLSYVALAGYLLALVNGVLDGLAHRLRPAEFEGRHATAP